MRLTDVRIRNVKPGEKTVKLFDGGGLYLEVTPSGGKWWRLKYRYLGKEKRMSLGTYPIVGLKDARERREQAKKLLSQGVDPLQDRQKNKATALAVAREGAITFEFAARDWYDKKTRHLTVKTRRSVRSRLEKHLLPVIGAKPIAFLEPIDILKAARQVESKGWLATAHEVIQIAGRICRHARLLGYINYDLTAGLSGALPALRSQHFSAITDPEKFGRLLNDIELYWGDISTRFALQILPYTFVRSNELRGAQWSEIDFDKAIWTIPAARMKSRRQHVVPLAQQVVDRLKKLFMYSGSHNLVFPSPYNRRRSLGDTALLFALRRMGYPKEMMSVHGFRTTASTFLNESGYRPDVIEMQLSHCERNLVRAAYNRAEYLEERRAMMQFWADHLDSLLLEQSNKNNSILQIRDN